ncbi:hypothetical protein HPB52_000818 [Rhipicephalus sanguineus]|uniref:Uncharacterized protein n=1 Tax=Rhipicephalus sanguineus TaxID=34632 RepID=A0A9D4PTG7_RHISA|nr:hypothetical protein HPB52_000818 [Rhipicephalus sanguineus]
MGYVEEMLKNSLHETDNSGGLKVQQWKSGNAPTPVPFEDEVENIRQLDDSLEPAERRDCYGVISKKARHNPSSTAPSPLSQSGTDTTAEPSGASEYPQASTPAAQQGFLSSLV